MPSFPIRPRLAVAINYRVNGRLCTNTLQYTAPAAAPTGAQMQSAADTISTRFALPYRNWLTEPDRFEGAEIRYISNAAGRYAVSANGAGPGNLMPTVGAGSGSAPLPTGDSVIIQKLGDGPPKAANGTLFLSGCSETFITNGRLLIGGLELAQSIGNALLVGNANVGVEGSPVTLSRGSPLAVPRVGALYTLIGMNVPDVLGHLRRRRPVR